MSNETPAEVVTAAVASGTAKATEPSAALVLFPAGITIVILMVMGLLTGGFALTPLAAMRGRVPWSAVGRCILLVAIGKIAAIWLPVMAFYGLGFKRAVVDFFVVPVGMLHRESPRCDGSAAGLLGAGRG